MQLSRCRATKNWACGGLGCFRSVAGGLRCARDLRRPRFGCSGGPTSRNNGGFSPLNQPTTWHKFAWPASVTQNKPCLGGQTPQIKLRFSTKFDRESLFFFFVEIDFRSNSEDACSAIHFLTNQMQLNSIRKKKMEIRFGKFLVNSGPRNPLRDLHVQTFDVDLNSYAAC